MDDFYIYYELPAGSPSQGGVIKAIAPILLKNMGDMDFIRVPAETGLTFNKGIEPLNQWVVKWNSDTDEMKLY